MLNTAASLIGPLEQSIMECFWDSGPRTSGQILKTLSQQRTIGHSTVTTSLGRLYAHGLLLHEPIPGHGAGNPGATPRAMPRAVS